MSVCVPCANPKYVRERHGVLPAVPDVSRAYVQCCNAGIILGSILSMLLREVVLP